MAKITFRADDDLVEALDEFEASKSEIMRRALRSYLDRHPQPTEETPNAESSGSIDQLILDRVDEQIDRRLQQRQPQQIDLNITLDGDLTDSSPSDSPVRKTPADDVNAGVDAGTSQCSQCGTTVDADHVYCPNCGEKISHRVFCECGDELRSDWGFCPSCGRRTPAADVLDNPDR